MIKTRFAPSPTGYLHIGGARTALFAWAWARKNGGEFLLRLEDTDAVRSREAHSRAIIDALAWLDLTPDAPPVFQSQNRARHQEIARRLLDEGRAYRCYCTPDELTAMRAAQTARGESPRYDRRWRDNTAAPPAGVSPSIRLKMPADGVTTFNDAVKGSLSVDNRELDDFILLRSDGAPTYNLAAVADDIDMGITHVIRGDDHVMNTFRQLHLFAALTPRPPVFAHLPMILAADGEDENGKARYARMSKRNAAVDVNLYRKDGFLPAALCNYLARLSWAHGDAELFARDFFVGHFDFAAVMQSPARFDMDKLRWLNREHLRALPLPDFRRLTQAAVSDAALSLLRARAATLNDAAADAKMFSERPAHLPRDILRADNAPAFAALLQALAALPQWTGEDIKGAIKQTAKTHALPFKDLGMPMRMLMFGKPDSPDIALSAAALGRDETLARLKRGGPP